MVRCASSARARSRRRPSSCRRAADRRAHRRTATRRGAWTHGDLALLEAVAIEAGLAIRLGRLLDENRDRLGQQSALLRAAQVSAASSSSETVLQRLVRRAGDAAAGRCVRLLPLRPRARRPALRRRARLRRVARRLRVRGRRAASPASRSARAARSSPPSTASVADEVPHPVVRRLHRRDRRADALERRGARRARRRAPRGDRPYTARDSDVLEAFAGLASLALRNAETFSRSARQARVQRGFYRIAAVLGQSLSRAATLDAVAQAAAEALGGAASAVLMPLGGRLVLAAARTTCRRSSRRAARGRARARRATRSCASAARGARRRRAALADDERLPVEWRSGADGAGYRALLSVPVDSPARRPGGLVAVLLRGAAHVQRGRPRARAPSSPTRRAARSSAASCTRPSGARARSRSSSRAPAGC